ncbi:MAG: STAS/SEC14 domain-containing protein [Rhodospirillaceae bacterium]|nr:STAS/SEC14 domain-containing protein [Rhodospirillaceae bacterium]
MFTSISDLPPGAIGFEAHGLVTAADQHRVLEATFGSARAAGGGIRLLYVAGTDFAGYEGGGAFDDAVFGTRNFTAFERIAFVADSGPYDRAVIALEGLMPATLRTFAPSEIDAAKAWIAGQE